MSDDEQEPSDKNAVTDEQQDDDLKEVVKVIREIQKPVVQIKPKEDDRKIRILTTPKIKQNILKEPVKKTSKYQLQLGAYKSSADAEKGKERLNKKYKELLNKQEYYIEKADLGAKGTFYRLKIISFGSEASARKLCDELRLKKQACLFIRN